MTKEELLRPRVKVIAPYPESPFEVGEILTIGEGSEFCEPLEWWDNYPHLFRRLAWWEVREVSDMPEYLKRFTKEIVKALDWRKGFGGLVYDFRYEGNKKIKNVSLTQNCTPATEEEYLEYIKTK